MSGDAKSNTPNLARIEFLVEQQTLDIKDVKSDVAQLRRVLLGNGDASMSLVYQVEKLKDQVQELREVQSGHSSLKEQVHMYKNRAIGIAAMLSIFWTIGIVVLGFILK